MHAATDRLEFAPPPQPAAFRAFALAVIAHLLLMAALTWGINWNKETENVSAEAELWSALPQQAAPPPPEPVAQTPPPPPPAPARVVEPPVQPDAQIAIEREKRKQLAAEEKRRELEEQKKLEAKRRKEDERREELAEKAAEKKAAEKAAEKKAAEDQRKKEEQAKTAKAKQDAAKREALRKENIARMMKGLEGGTGSPSSTGSAKQASGPSASYGGKVQARVRPYIVFPEDAPGNPQAEVEVRTSPDGTIVGSRIVKASGVKAWDDAVLAALAKAETLPRDVDGRVPTPLVIVFKRRN